MELHCEGSWDSCAYTNGGRRLYAVVADHEDWHQGRHLPMHQPVVTLCPRAEWHNTAHHFCTFCHYGLENKQGELGPFEGCWFCLDRPAWHHGHCCPHNSASREWNGIPHLRLYRSSAQWEPPTWTEQDPNPHQDSREFRSWLRTLPF